MWERALTIQIRVKNISLFLTQSLNGFPRSELEQGLVKIDNRGIVILIIVQNPDKRGYKV